MNDPRQPQRMDPRQQQMMDPRQKSIRKESSMNQILYFFISV